MALGKLQATSPCHEPARSAPPSELPQRPIVLAYYKIACFPPVPSSFSSPPIFTTNPLRIMSDEQRKADGSDDQQQSSGGDDSSRQQTSSSNDDDSRQQQSSGGSDDSAQQQTSSSNDDDSGDSGEQQEGGGDGEKKDKKKGATQENVDSIPTAGGERLGEKHWGESKIVPDVPKEKVCAPVVVSYSCPVTLIFLFYGEKGEGENVSSSEGQPDRKKPLHTYIPPFFATMLISAFRRNQRQHCQEHRWLRRRWR